MKLRVNFSQLYQAVNKMGAEEVDFKIEAIDFDESVDFDEILGTTGQVVDLEDIEVNDNLLSYKGRQVLLYIPDQGKRIESVLLNSQNGTKFHVADCKTLQEMKQKKRFDRYIVTNNLSGIFEINGINSNDNEIINNSKLHVCKNCLSLLNYKNYKQNKKVFDDFRINEFFEIYSTFFTNFPKFEEKIYASSYSIDWNTISSEYKNSKNYVCETCETSFRNNKTLLHTHHINGIKEDNSLSNLKAVCIDCHRKEPNHENIMLNRQDLEKIIVLRREQNKINIKNWEDVFKFSDVSVHNYIHLLKTRDNMKIPDVGYILEIKEKKLILDLVWITNTKKSALVTEFTNDYFDLEDWNILTLSDALYNFNELDEKKKKNTFKELKDKFKATENVINKKIDIEISEYSKYIQSIENIRFERIRKYCENLLNDNQADDMQKYLAENGRRDKALIYSVLDNFVGFLLNKSIDVIDWSSNQGIVSMLFLDYIKEKQIDINVSNITVIDNNEKALKRALLHLNKLKQYDINIKALNKNIQSVTINELALKEDIIIHFYGTLLNNNYENRKVSLLDSIKSIKSTKNYFICIGSTNDKRIDDFYKYSSEKFDVELVTEFDKKIGKYDLYGKIFKKI